MALDRASFVAKLLVLEVSLVWVQLHVSNCTLPAGTSPTGVLTKRMVCLLDLGVNLCIPPVARAKECGFPSNISGDLSGA